MSKAGEVIAIIPARGGSKGIPRKNLQLLGDKPLVAWSIEAALCCPGVDRVVVSTEDEEIAEVSKAFGAEVPFLRPAVLSRDDSNIGEAITYTLDRLSSEGATFAGWLELYPTHPFRTKAMMDAAVAAIRHGHRMFQTVKPIMVNSASFVRKREDGTIVPVVTQLEGLRLGVHFRRYGLAIAFSINSDRQTCFAYPVCDQVSLIDIDTIEDLEQARSIVCNKLHENAA